MIECDMFTLQMQNTESDNKRPKTFGLKQAKKIKKEEILEIEIKESENDFQGKNLSERQERDNKTTTCINSYGTIRNYTKLYETVRNCAKLYGTIWLNILN